jgi:hypothetical protein
MSTSKHFSSVHKNKKHNLKKFNLDNRADTSQNWRTDINDPTLLKVIQPQHPKNVNNLKHILPRPPHLQHRPHPPHSPATPHPPHLLHPPPLTRPLPLQLPTCSLHPQRPTCQRRSNSLHLITPRRQSFLKPGRKNSLKQNALQQAPLPSKNQVFLHCESRRCSKLGMVTRCTAKCKKHLCDACHKKHQCVCGVYFCEVNSQWQMICDICLKGKHCLKEVCFNTRFQCTPFKYSVCCNCIEEKKNTVVLTHSKPEQHAICVCGKELCPDQNNNKYIICYRCGGLCHELCFSTKNNDKQILCCNCDIVANVFSNPTTKTIIDINIPIPPLVSIVMEYMETYPSPVTLKKCAIFSCNKSGMDVIENTPSLPAWYGTPLYGTPNLINKVTNLCTDHKKFESLIAKDYYVDYKEQRFKEFMDQQKSNEYYNWGNSSGYGSYFDQRGYSDIYSDSDTEWDD